MALTCCTYIVRGGESVCVCVKERQRESVCVRQRNIMVHLYRGIDRQKENM